jgi:hypothetical protein
VYYWNGSSCLPQVACECAGPDCGQGFASEAECMEHYGRCTDSIKPCGGFLGDTCAEDEYCAYVPGPACGITDGGAVCAPIPDACDANFDPVCGCDGETHGNACEAAMARTGVISFGACE